MGRKAKCSPEQYRDCAARGLSKAETARALGVTWKSVSSAAKMHRIKFRRGHRSDHVITPQKCAMIGEVKASTPAPEPSPISPIVSGRAEKALRMHSAGHPPGVIADYTGMSRGDVVMLLESVA